MTEANQQPLNTMNTVNFQDLIINSPEKQVVWKRMGFFLLTLGFWGAWIFLWTPLPGLAQQLILTGFSEFSWRPATYVVVFFAMFFSLATWQIGWLNYNLARFKTRGRRSNQTLLSNQELGQFFTVDNRKLNNWQQSKCLVIQHNDTGEIQEIDVNDFFSFAPSLSKAEDKQLQQYYIVILPDKAGRQLFERVANDFVVIMKVLCSIFNIKFINCQVAEDHLALSVQIPTDYNADNMVNQLKLASASILKRKYSEESNLQMENQAFWRSEQLVTTTILTSHEIQQFFAQIISGNKQWQPEAESITISSKKQQTASRLDKKESRLATEFWQNSQRLIIENQETKKKSQIDINDFFVCAPLPLDEDYSEGKYERFFVVILPTEQQRTLFAEIDEDFRTIMKVLCSLFRIGLVDCIVTRTHLTLALDIPEGYDPNEFVEQLKRASTLIIEKKYGPGPATPEAEALTFWRDEQLVTTPELVDTEIKGFINSIL